MENYRSVTMEMRQHGGGAFSQFPPLEFNSDTAISDDFFTLDPNIFFTSPVDNIVSDFSSLLDSTSQNSFDPGALSQSGLPNGSMLPADEWSGTTNALPGTPSSQHLQHGLESSSPLHSQAQPLQPAPQASKQQHYMFENHMTGSSQTSQEVLGNQQHIDQKPTNEQLEFVTAQGKSQQLGFQGGNSQLGMHAVKVENLHSVKLENQGAQGTSRPGTFLNQPGELHGSSTFSSEQPLAQSMSNNVHDVAMQDHHFQGLQSSAQQSDFDGGGAQQHMYQQNRSFDAIQGRAMPPHLAGFQSAQAGESQQSATHRAQGSSPQINFPKIPMTNHHFSLPGNNSAQQMSLQNQQNSMNHLQGLDSESNQALVQSQMATNQASYSVHGGSLQSRFMPKPSSHQSLLQTHSLSSQIPSFQMQHNNHQLQGQGHGQAQAKALSQVAQLNSQQAAANQQALLQPRQVQLSHQQPVFSTNQQPPYQLLQSQGYQVHQNSAGHLPGGARQMFSQMQPRLQSHILQGLKIAPRQLGQSFAGSPLAGVMETGGRYPLPPTHAAKCIQVFMLYIQEQRKRPSDNNIGFWRNLVQKFFAQGATKRWCLTSYNTSPVGRHAQGLFPMDYWFCNLCGVQPGRGFESSTDVLPRLFKIKYDSGLVDELLFLDIPTDKYVLPSGKVVLEYANAVHESVFQELRVVRYGKLRVTFGNNFKICAWEFCTRSHEEVVPRKNLLQQVQQLASLVVESDHEAFDRSAENLKSHCNMFTKTAKQLAVQLDAPMVNDLGFSKRYVRCLQIAEVVNSMKDLISFERKTGLGPIESLAKFPSGRKLQMEGALSGMSPSMSLSQMINEITQGSHVGQPSLQMSTITSRLPSESMTEVQGQTYSHGQSALFKGVDPNMAQSINQMQPQFRSQMESRLSHLFQSQAYNHMQPSIGSQAQSVGLVQSLSANQLSQLTAQGQTQCQLSSGQLASQSLSQQQQQVYQQNILKSAPKSSSQVLSQPQSLNQASLPGTPQSEMSDMRSNT